MNIDCEARQRTLERIHDIQRGTKIKVKENYAGEVKTHTYNVVKLYTFIAVTERAKEPHFRQAFSYWELNKLLGRIQSQNVKEDNYKHHYKSYTRHA